MLFTIRKKLSDTDLQTLIQQLAQLLKAGFNLSEALEHLQQNNSAEKWQELLIKLQTGIHQGLNLSTAFAEFPHYFSDHSLALIRCAEHSGQLIEILTQLAEYQKLKLNFKKKAWRAFAYPGFVLGSSLSISLGIMLWVVPLFAQLFNQSHQALPPLTHAILVFSENLPRYLLLISISLLSFFYFARLALATYFPLRWQLSLFFTHCPGFASLIQILQLNHWLPLMANYLSAGIHLFESLQAASPAFDQLYYQAAYQHLVRELAAGHSLGQSLQKNPIFPKELVSRIGVGERSGNLNQAFLDAAVFYEQELQNFLSYLTQLIEPISLLLISALIGMLIVALYLPIFKMGEMF